MMRFAAGLLVLAAAGTVAAAPDARLEAALSTNVISQIDRSVQLHRTIPPVEKPRKRAVDPGEAVKVAEDVYVDRRLMPPDGGARGDDPAVRVFRRDVR